MAKRTISCFISFSSADAVERDVQFLISILEELTEGKVEFKAYFQKPIGHNLQEFMQDELLESHAIIALYSPDYKTKADFNKPSGVSDEHRRIVDLLEDAQADLLFLPILWKGADYASALPEIFLNRYFASNLTKFQAYGSDGRPDYLPQAVERTIRPELEKIASGLLQKWYEQDPASIEIQERMDEQFLGEPTFTVRDDRTSEDAELRRKTGALVTKAERNGLSVEEFDQYFFVKTSAYRSVGENHKIAFTGRKGSGKTTLLKMYKYHNYEKYFRPIDIEVNDWNLHYILGDLTFKSTEGDLNYTETESRIFDFI